LVTGPPAVDIVLVLHALEGVEGPVADFPHVHGVDMAVKDDDGFATANASHDIAHGVDLDFVVVQGLHFFDDSFHYPGFVHAGGGNGNHIP